MGRSKEEMEGVTLLGNKDVKYSMDYAPEMLQTFDNKHPDNDYFVKFNCLHRPVLQLRQTGNKVGGGCLEPSGKPRPLP